MRNESERRFNEPRIDGERIRLYWRDCENEYMERWEFYLFIEFDEVEGVKATVKALESESESGCREYTANAKVKGLQNALEFGEKVLDKIYDEMDWYHNKGRQRIGVKDEHGKEIYVGDVVYGTVMDYFGVEDWSYNIEIINENGEFKARVIESGYTTPIDDENLEFIKVVGNVNDNPELLKRDEEGEI